MDAGWRRKRVHVRFGSLAVGLSLAAGQVVALEVYKSRDDESGVVYSQTRPAQPGYEVLTVRPPRPTVSEDAFEDRKAFLKAREDRMRENCEIARQNLRILGIPAEQRRFFRIQSVDDSGKPTPMDDAQIRSRRLQLEQEVRDACE